MGIKIESKVENGVSLYDRDDLANREKKQEKRHRNDWSGEEKEKNQKLKATRKIKWAVDEKK